MKGIPSFIRFRIPFLGVALAGAVVLMSACDPAAPEPEAEASPKAYQVRTMIDEDLIRPWSIAFLPDGAWLITERVGRLRVVRDGKLDPQPVEGGPEVLALMEGGLLDVALHPEFEDNGYVYLSYTRRCTENCGTTTVLGRGRWDGERLTDFRDLYAADACDDDYRHYGGRIVLTDDGYLFLSVGERNRSSRAQDPGDDAGAILRLTWDGEIPADNPYAGRNDASAAVWSHGHRNPQGLVLHPETGRLWQHEHGPSGGDEVNRIEPGRNYGWPVITHGTEYNGQPIGEGAEKEGMEQPLVHWTPSIAPSGMTFYDGKAFPEWQGNLFMGSLSRLHLRRLELDGETVVDQEPLIDDLGHRIRDVRQGPDGYLYVLVDADRGQVLRLEPAE